MYTHFYKNDILYTLGITILNTEYIVFVSHGIGTCKKTDILHTYPRTPEGKTDAIDKMKGIYLWNMGIPLTRSAINNPDYLD